MASIDQIKKLRELTGVSMIECRNALDGSSGDLDLAQDILRKSGALKAAKKSERQAGQGIIEAYIHSNGKIGVLLELNCETDFVARNEEFKTLAHNIAMHVAAMAPRYVSPEDIPEEYLSGEKEIYKEQVGNSGKPQNIIDQIIEGKLNKFKDEICLLTQPFIKNPDIAIKDLIEQCIAKLGENIKVGRFARYQIQ